VLLDHYKAKYDEYGHDPRHRYVGAGAGFLYLAQV
jgi:hypothetical protein